MRFVLGVWHQLFGHPLDKVIARKTYFSVAVFYCRGCRLTITKKRR